MAGMGGGQCVWGGIVHQVGASPDVQMRQELRTEALGLDALALMLCTWTLLLLPSPDVQMRQELRTEALGLDALALMLCAWTLLLLP